MTRPDPDRRGPTRRQAVALGAGVFAVAALPRWLRPAAPALVRRAAPVMGTTADLAVAGLPPAAAREAIDAALDALYEVERRMTRFRRDSEVGRVNGAAGRRSVTVSGGTRRVLEAALAWARASDGSFDPCLAGPSVLWDVGRRTRPPAPAEVAREAGRGRWRALDLSPAGPGARVFLRRADAGLDLGGIAKGYGVDRAVAALRARGVRDGLVNVGGDLYALGRSPDGDAWRVGIRSPRHPDALAGTLEVSDRAVATSGDYERYFRFGGRRYHHLIDPDTGAPRRSRMHSVTVAAGDCMAADAAATVAFGRPEAETRALLAHVEPDAEIVILR